MQMPEWVEKYCKEYGWTEPYFANKRWWAFPVGAVIASEVPVPMPDRVTYNFHDWSIYASMPEGLLEDCMSLIAKQYAALEALVDEYFREELGMQNASDGLRPAEGCRVLTSNFPRLEEIAENALRFAAVKPVMKDLVEKLENIEVELPELTGFAKFQAEKFQTDQRITSEEFDRLRSLNKVAFRRNRWEYNGKQKGKASYQKTWQK